MNDAWSQEIKYQSHDNKDQKRLNGTDVKLDVKLIDSEMMFERVFYSSPRKTKIDETYKEFHTVGAHPEKPDVEKSNKAIGEPKKETNSENAKILKTRTVLITD